MFDENKLIECGKLLANRLDLPVPNNKEFSLKINEIFIERGNYECAKLGLITKEETASLILQHFQTLICRLANAPGPSEPYFIKDISEQTINALFPEQ